MSNLYELTATEASAKIANGEITSVELVQSCLDRIHQREGDVGAWAHLDEELTLSATRAADAAEAKSPFHGIPFGVKDVIDTAERVALALGHSMGAIQTYHWAALYPDMVERVAPICGSARTSIHNYAFLEGMKAVLTSDPEWRDGDYDDPPAAGLRAMARAWAPWPPSQGFYREEKYKELGHASLDAFLVDYWERWSLSLDANNTLAQIWTWRQSDISANELYGGNFDAALAAISAKAIVLPSQTDTYFPPQDSEYEVAHMPNAELRPIPSIWGHWAGSGKNPADTAFIDRALTDLLAR